MSYKLKIGTRFLDLKEDIRNISCSRDRDYDMTYILEEKNNNFVEIGKVVKSLCAVKLQEARFIKAGRDTCFYIDKALIDSLSFKPTESNSVLEVELPHKIAHGLSVDFVRFLKDYSGFEVIGTANKLRGLFLLLDKTFERAFVLEFEIAKNEK